MPRNITVTLQDGSTHVYRNAPDNVSPQAVQARAQKEFNMPVTALDGGRSAAPAKPLSAVDQYVQRWQGIDPQKARALVLKQQQVAMNSGTIDQFFKDPRVQALGKIAGMKPQALSSTEQSRQTTFRAQAAGRSAAQANRKVQTDRVSANLGGVASSGGVGEALGAVLLKATGRSDYSLGDTFAALKAKDEAQKSLDPEGALAGNILGSAAPIAIGGSAVGRVAGKLAASAAPRIAQAGNFLQKLTTLEKGETLANTGKAALAGGAGGGALAAGEGEDAGGVARATALGAGTAGVLGLGAAGLNKVLVQPAKDLLRLSSADGILKRITSTSKEQIQKNIAALQAKGVTNPTFYEALPLTDRNNLANKLIKGRANVGEATNKALDSRAASLKDDLQSGVNTAVAPRKAQIQQQLTDDLASAHGVDTPTPEHEALAARAVNSPTDLKALQQTEAKAIMTPHENTPVASSVNDLVPQMHGVETAPEISSIIRSAAGPIRLRAEDQPVTADDVSSILKNLHGFQGGADPAKAADAGTAATHVQTWVNENYPEVGAALQKMNDTWAKRARMLEGVKAGSDVQLRDMRTNGGSGTSGDAAQWTRNAHDTPEGQDGLFLGQSRQTNDDLVRSPEQAVRASGKLADGSIAPELNQNLGPDVHSQVVDAANAQNEVAQSLVPAARAASTNDPNKGNIAKGVSAALIATHPGAWFASKTHAFENLARLNLIPESRARTIVDMIFSQNPALRAKALEAMTKVPGAAESGALQLLGGVAGQAGAATGEQVESQTGTPAQSEEPLAPIPNLDGSEDSNSPLEPIPELDSAPADAPQGASPYDAKLEGFLAQENPDFVGLLNKQWHQESGGQQMGPDGQPLTSSAGAIGAAQVMPGTAPEAAKLAGLPWDENAYKTDASYNKLLGAAYMAEQLRKHKGDVAKAAASYNAGPAKVDAALTIDPNNWLSHLPAETQHYVQVVN